MKISKILLFKYSPEIPPQEIRRIVESLGAWPTVQHIWRLEKAVSGRGSATTQVPDTGVPRQRSSVQTQTEATYITAAVQTAAPTPRRRRPPAKAPRPAPIAAPPVTQLAAPVTRRRPPPRRIAPVAQPYVRPPAVRFNTASTAAPDTSVVIDLSLSPTTPPGKKPPSVPRARGTPTIKADSRVHVDPKLLKEIFGEDLE
ncbi:hypothetical protein TKK_0010839 [Trichogramma kaykai]